MIKGLREIRRRRSGVKNGAFICNSGFILQQIAGLFPDMFSLSSIVYSLNTKKPPPHQGAEVYISAVPPSSSRPLLLRAYIGAGGF
jgi:hypothetical protein